MSFVRHIKALDLKESALYLAVLKGSLKTVEFLLGTVHAAKRSLPSIGGPWMFELSPNSVIFRHLLPSLSAGIDDRWRHIPLDLKYIVPAKNVQMQGAQKVIILEEETDDEVPDLEGAEDEEIGEVQNTRVIEDGKIITQLKESRRH
jgi:hypothetical protein